MIELVVGLPGQGKSLTSARTVLDLLARNERWFKKSGIRRRIASNMPFAPFLLERFPEQIVYWKTLEEVVLLEDVDVIWDEVANQMDARNWLNLPESVKHWLRHHDKVGVEVYANTQHLEAVDVQFRRLINRLYVVTKLFGSPRPAVTKPPIAKVWGVVMLRQHDPKLYAWQSDTGEVVKSAIGMPSFFWMSRRLVAVYDTRYKILADAETSLRHIVKRCPTCRTEKVVHV